MSTKYGLLLTAIEPLSHHDPRKGGESNTLTFLRMPQVVERTFVDTPVFQHLVDRLTAQHPMPESLAELMSRFNLVEFIGVAFTRLVIDIYNSYDGSGLFSGMERYQMLDARLETSAVKSGSLRTLWDVLTRDLNLTLHPERHDEMLVTFFTLPPSVQFQVLAMLSDQHKSSVSVARLWHTKNKQQSAAYAEKAGTHLLEEQIVSAHYDISDLPDAPTVSILRLPYVSPNSIRHQMVRYPGWLDLCERIGFAPGQVGGDGLLTPAQENLFDSGGNIQAGVPDPAQIPGLQNLVAMFGNGGYKESGSKEKANGFFLAQQIRRAYPLLDLVGGVCNAFDLGESMLAVQTHLVCRENRAALPAQVAASPQAQHGAFDYLSEVTRTRQAVMDAGQMIYNYEVLIAGTQVYTEFTLKPICSLITEGALLSALDYYACNLSNIGGQVARGHGMMDVKQLGDINTNALNEYRAYLHDNAEQLREWLLDGSLGTGIQWVVK